MKFIPTGFAWRGLRGRARVALLAPALASLALAQTPAQQVPQPAPAPAPTAPAAPTTPPPPPKPRIPPDQKIENMWSGSVFYWRASGPPNLRGGTPSTDSGAQFLNLNGPPHRPLGIEFTTPAGRFDRFEFSGWHTTGTGSDTASRALLLYQTPIPSGDLLYTYYQTRNFKASWNYLTYPAPPDSKWRFKTLWEVQYDEASVTFDAPADVNAITTNGSKRVILPTLGLGIEYHPEKHIRLELKASGFALYHHADIWDAEASVVFRIRRVEALIGARASHFKTSPNSDEYFAQTQTGPYIGLRYLFTK